MSSFSDLGWSLPTTPLIETKIAALAALASLPASEPVAEINYESAGRLLVIGEGVRVAQAVAALAPVLAVSVLWTGSDTPPVFPDVPLQQAALVSLKGYLGAFTLVSQRPGDTAQSAPFDLVLDLQRAPVFALHQPPQGYFHAADSAAFERALAELPEMVGSFEKPKFFAYRDSLCAHSRSRKTGCSKCIDICSTAAISSAGDTVKVDPHLCMGCGACATVCPTGAMRYQYPSVADRGATLRALLRTWRENGGEAAPIILFVNPFDGRQCLDAIASQGRGLPAHVLPLEAWHVASIGLDVLLGAVAYGAGGVALLAAGSEAPDYARACQAEMAVGDALLNALGYDGQHFFWVDAAEAGAAEAALWALSPQPTVAVPGVFHLSSDKRGTLEFALDHLLAQASRQPAEVALPAGSLYGAILVNAKTCTLCLACAGACPVSALMDGGEVPQLRFLERNCVQCGLCRETCPEAAITLVPRLLLTEQRKQTVTLHEAAPFHCISCGKVLGTQPMIQRMLDKLSGHSMFQGEGALKRLQMCADCRVVDMMSNPHESSVLTGKARP
ncbi:MAG: 4Fe-4S binding protein [Betaproteobacteria bacterium]|nr:4Fe-4S binding protein [Betaproteobacteria bacterium]